jgi:hypothetical protein
MLAFLLFQEEGNQQLLFQIVLAASNSLVAARQHATKRSHGGQTDCSRSAVRYLHTTLPTFNLDYGTRSSRQQCEMVSGFYEDIKSSSSTSMVPVLSTVDYSKYIFNFIIISSTMIEPHHSKNVNANASKIRSAPEIMNKTTTATTMTYHAVNMERRRSLLVQFLLPLLHNYF